MLNATISVTEIDCYVCSKTAQVIDTNGLSVPCREIW